MINILKALDVVCVTASPLNEDSWKFLKSVGFSYVRDDRIGDRFVEAPMEKWLNRPPKS